MPPQAYPAGNVARAFIRAVGDSYRSTQWGNVAT
jgi:hypothetical protein